MTFGTSWTASPFGWSRLRGVEENAARLLVPEAVNIGPVDTVEKVAVESDRKVGMSVGLIVFTEAKPERVQTIRIFNGECLAHVSLTQIHHHHQ